MNKQKKICFCFTPRQLIGTVLLAVSAVNLIIVGAAFKGSTPTAAPPSTVVHAIDPMTLTSFIVTATEGTLLPIEPTGTPTPTATLTPTDTPTLTSTSTSTDTPSPTATVCTPYYHWPIYFIQRGDTLYSISLKTGSSVEELIRANCLSGTVIVVGQSLYVPRLPTAIPTDTPQNTATIFQNPPVCWMMISDEGLVFFSVVASDPDGISTIIASYSIIDSEVQGQAFLKADGEAYYGASGLSEEYLGSTISYSFIATDNFGVITESIKNRSTLDYCNVVEFQTFR
jgi:LysM repeat protein